MALNPIDLHRISAGAGDGYFNMQVAQVNDHVIRISVMHEPFYWHIHPTSDEVFYVLEGTLLIELEEGQVELQTGQMLTIPAATPHTTSPIRGRSVNITIESASTTTERVEPPGIGPP